MEEEEEEEEEEEKEERGGEMQLQAEQGLTTTH